MVEQTRESFNFLPCLMFCSCWNERLKLNTVSASGALVAAAASAADAAAHANASRCRTRHYLRAASNAWLPRR